MIWIDLYRIRNWVRGLTPLYISICAALFLDLKSNIKWENISILYFLGLISFIIACVVSNELSNRCNNYGRIYDIKYSNGKTLCRKKIYDEYEQKLNCKKRYFQYFGVFIFGVLGLVFVITSYSLHTQSHRFDNNKIILQQQVDSLKMVNIEYKERILELKIENDSIKNNLLNFKNTALPLKSGTNVNNK